MRLSTCKVCGGAVEGERDVNGRDVGLDCVLVHGEVHTTVILSRGAQGHWSLINLQDRKQKQSRIERRLLCFTSGQQKKKDVIPDVESSVAKSIYCYYCTQEILILLKYLFFGRLFTFHDYLQTHHKLFSDLSQFQSYILSSKQRCNGTISIVFGMTRFRIEPTTYQSQSGHSTTRPLSCYFLPMTLEKICW